MYYIYIYIYVCVCVCVCIHTYIKEHIQKNTYKKNLYRNFKNVNSGSLGHRL